MARAVKQVTALDVAKHLSTRLSKLVERRDRQVEKATSEFRLDMLAAVEDADDETIDLVQRGLKLDGGSQFLRAALQAALDERDRGRQTRRSRSVEVTGGEAAEIMGDSPAPRFELGPDVAPDSDDAPLPTYGVTIVESPDIAAGVEVVPAYRYPEPGEPAVELADGTIVAAS